VITDPKTEAEREAIAGRCVRELGLTIPTVIDGMDNKIGNAYAAWPDRIYIVGVDGKIAYQGEPGPRGFKPSEAKAALLKIL
jgi:hypothetical protein